MRTFEKDGHRVTTESPTEAVSHLARGYVEILDEEPEQPYASGGLLPSGDQTVRIPKGTTVFHNRPPADERNNAPD